MESVGDLIDAEIVRRKDVSVWNKPKTHKIIKKEDQIFIRMAESARDQLFMQGIRGPVTDKVVNALLGAVAKEMNRGKR